MEIIEKLNLKVDDNLFRKHSAKSDTKSRLKMI